MMSSRKAWHHLILGDEYSASQARYLASQVKGRISMIIRNVSVLMVAILFAGCGGGGGSGVGSTPPPGGNNPPPPPDPNLTALLVPPDSEEAFTSHVKKGLALWSGVGTDGELSEVTALVANTVDVGGTNDATNTPNAPALPSTDSPGSASAESFSRTNLQVQGVDEQDWAKFSGTHLYIASDDRIDVLSTSNDPAATTKIGSLNVGEDSYMQGMYLLAADGESPPLLAAISTLSSHSGWNDGWAQPWGWQQGKTVIHLFDISTPQDGNVLAQLTLDGYAIHSRRIGDFLYLVTRHTPALKGLIPHATEATEVASNQQIIDASDIEDLLPQMTASGESPRNLVTADSCFLPETAADEVSYPTLVTLTAVDLRDPDDVSSICMADNIDGIHVSLDAVYLTSSEGFFGDVVTIAAAGVAEFSNQSRTIVHKFKLTDMGPAYRGSGVVPGTFQNDPSYLMGEHEGVLAIVTSGSWDGDHRLTLLRESATEAYRLEETGHLPNDLNPSPIGKPGERIYASRIIRDRAYIVTFRIIDPVYVIDLSDPTSPRTLGELEIPGYSAYLHPVSGIGKDAIVDNGTAWYQALNLRLFDVSDPTRPFNVSEVKIGLRGTDSTLLYDPHALLYLPDVESDVHRFAIPVSLHGADQQRDSGAHPSTWFSWSSTGLHLFEIDAGANPSLTTSGVVDSDDVVDCWLGSDRAFINGSAVHYVHDGRVVSADWQQPHITQDTVLRQEQHYCSLLD